MSHYQTVDALLSAIQREMEAQSIWEAVAPSDAALSSTEPFCVDTLAFTEWIQWLLLPKLRLMIKQDMALPQNSNIHVMAEEALKLTHANSATLLDLIKQLDQALTVHH